MGINEGLLALEREMSEANRYAIAAVEEHVRAGRSTYFGDAEHVYERTADGAIYEVFGEDLRRIRFIRFEN